MFQLKRFGPAQVLLLAFAISACGSGEPDNTAYCRAVQAAKSDVVNIVRGETPRTRTEYSRLALTLHGLADNAHQESVRLSEAWTDLAEVTEGVLGVMTQYEIEENDGSNYGFDAEVALLDSYSAQRDAYNKWGSEIERGADNDCAIDVS